MKLFFVSCLELFQREKSLTSHEDLRFADKARFPAF